MSSLLFIGYHSSLYLIIHWQHAKIFKKKKKAKKNHLCSHKSVSRVRLSVWSGHFIFTIKELSQDIILSYKAL